MRKALVYILTFVITFTQVLPHGAVSALSTGGNTAHAAAPGEPDKDGNVKSSNDLVVLVVDSSLDNNTKSYNGLKGQYGGLSSSTLGDRIERYAEDIVENNELTDVKFLFYDDASDSVEDLVEALETLYFEDGMVGAVFIGNVPLPVVNNNGNRYISMFPYTDFVEPVYVYDQERDSFERDGQVNFPQAEIWHGVIRPDDESNASYEEMAAYFDKNHLYYEDDPNFSDFDKKLFFGDLIAEKTKLNEDVFEQHMNYLDSWEDLAYNRYNKFWAQDLTNEVTGAVEDLKGEGEPLVNTEIDDPFQSQIAEDFAKALENDPILQIPDIYTKQIIDKLLPKYYEVLSNYIAQSNSLVENTGRYNAEEVDNLPVLISIKDEYTKNYLRSVNDAIENEVNKIALSIQEPIPILDYSKLSGKYGDNSFEFDVKGKRVANDFLDDLQILGFELAEAGGELLDPDIAYDILVAASKIPPGFSLDGSGKEITYRFHYRNETANSDNEKWKLFINGIDAEVINSPQLCLPYLGSTKSEYFVDTGAGFEFVPGEYSILTQSLRSNNLMTAQAKHTVGINTRLVPKDEALSLSGNKAVNGAVVESFPGYGVSAFIQNTTSGDYSNPLEAKLQEDDLIVKVDGVFLDYTYSFDMAIEAAFQKVKQKMDEQDKGEMNGDLLIEFYSGDSYETESFDFKVKEDNGVYESSGAIFTLYDNKQGFSGKGYDNSAGCNLASTQYNSDRCFARIATMPVLDPAGSVAPVSAGDELKFPANIEKKIVEPEGGIPYVQNANSPDALERSVEIFQFPGGLADDYYQFEDIDELYLNSCYSGLPGLGKLGGDSNPNKYALDPKNAGDKDNDMDRDFYGQFLNLVGNYILDYGDENEYPDNYDQSVKNWNEIDDLDAGDIILNENPKITLKDFSDHYGLFDGKDNDEDGEISDYEWRDLDNDGVKEFKWWDYNEGQEQYGIPSWDLDQIGRKLLSHDSSFTVPAEVSGFDKDITLNVNAHSYENTTIPSLIIHNEPTDYTIAQQVQSMGAFSLPIDNPRYVAFQAEPEALPDAAYNDDEDLPHYYPGDTVRVDYPNLFEAPNLAQVQSDINAVALELAQISGSYRVFGSGAQPEQYSTIDIQQKILKDHFEPVLKSLLDDPLDGFELRKTSEAKLYDALEWKEMNIDEKHAYVMKNYLNAEENAYVADSTLFPAQTGFGVEAGYEAAYLVLDGEENYFDLQFNKDLPDGAEDELFELFGPNGSSGSSGSGSLGGGDNQGGDDGSEGSGGGSDFAEDAYNFVGLPQFVEEVIEFISFFTTEPNFAQACSYGGHVLTDGNQVSDTLSYITLEVDRDIVSANGQDQIEAIVRGFGEDGLPTSSLVTELITLNIIQTAGDEKFLFANGNAKSLVNGEAKFTLQATTVPGTATIQAVSQNDFESDGVQITGVKRSIFLNAPQKIVADGETVHEIEASLLDDEGVLNVGAGGTVKFTLVGGDGGQAEFVGSSTVDVVAGKASVKIKSGTKTGDIKIQAQASATGYPIEVKDLRVAAGEPFSIVAIPESTLLIANNQSKTRMELTVLDKFGNIVDDAFSQIALFSNDTVLIDPTVDLNSSIIGTQVMTMEGKANVDILSKAKVGKATVIAILLTPELEEEFILLGDAWQQLDFSEHIGTAKTLHVADPSEVSLKVKLDKQAISVGGETMKIRVELLRNGEIVSGYNGPIEVNLANDVYGGIISDSPEKMAGGVLHEANTVFKSSVKAGEVSMFVDLPGFVSDNIEFKVLPGPKVSIELTSSEDVLKTDGLDEVILEARILDKYSNLVFNDNSSLINFSSTEGTADFVEFTGAKSAVASEGIATTTIRGGDVSGKANLIASGDDLLDGWLALDVVKRIGHIKASDFAPRAMYVSLLGGPFGDIKTGESLASSILFNGASQAVSAVTTTPDVAKRLFGVDAFGGIEILDTNVESNVFAATDSFPYQKIIFTDTFEDEELAEMFMVPKPGLVVHVVNEIPVTEGIFVQKLSDDENLRLTELSNLVTLKNGVKNVAAIDNFGRITLSDDSIKLSLDEESPYLRINLQQGGKTLVSVTYKQNFEKDVKIMGYGDKSNAALPGVYMKINTAKSNYDSALMFSGSSTAEDFGAYLVDTDQELAANQAPGFSYNSLESAADIFGIGFQGSNKHMLLFSGGNSVGESNRVYASEVGIVYGDPLVSLDPEDHPGVVSSLTHYSKDIGVPILNSKEPILDMIEFDYNADGYMDLLAVYEDGLVKLLENEVSNKEYRDRGYILNVSEGILSASRVDVNNDGFDDLIVGTQESCRVDETCLSLFTNVEGNFTRDILDIGIPAGTKIYDIKSGDLNNDGCEDVVFSDSAAKVQFMYNEISGGQCAGLEYEPSLSENFGVSIDSEINAIGTVFVHYAGMPQLTNLNGDKFVKFVLESPQRPSYESSDPNLDPDAYQDSASDLEALVLSGGAIASAEIPPRTYSTEFNFINATATSALDPGSERRAVDVNGKTIAVGDKIKYTITLENNTGGLITDLMLSDLTPTTMTLIEDSLLCEDSNCADELEWLETGLSLRSNVITGINVPAGGKRTISYMMQVDEIGKVNIELGHDLSSYKDDNYLDVMVRPTLNPEGTLKYLYSDGLENGLVEYKLFEEGPGGFDHEDVLADEFENQGLPNLSEVLGFADQMSQYDGPIDGNVDPDSIPSPPAELQSSLNDLQSSQGHDSDYNGCTDSWAAFNEAYEDAAASVAGNIKGLSSALKCGGGGCLPIPYNYAFLAPDDAIPGTAIVAFGVPNPIGFAPMYPSVAPSSFRLYLNPTLTMGLGTAACAGPGPGHASPCFAFAVPLSSLGACPDFLGPINDAVAAASEATLGGDAGTVAVVSDGSEANSSDAISASGNFSDPASPISTGTDVNIKVPGIPSVLTNWIDKQTDEIFNKLLDLPDFYFIYPDVSTLINDPNINFEGEISSMHDFLSAVNSIPLVNIETREVLLKIPTVSQQEIEKYKQQADAWIKHHQDLLERLEEYWSCDANSQRENLCDIVRADLTKTINSVQQFLEILDRLSQLPQKLLNWRHLESKYATQIVCYLDAIMDYTGGYIERQETTVESWMKAADDAIETFETWKSILDLMTEYQESCDECKNDRFSKLGLVMQLFVAIPEPPIIPIPKWPDIVFDISQIRTGANIVWPDIKFEAEYVELPDLPVINLPDISALTPDVAFETPGFEIPDVFLALDGFDIPNLPDLPPLPLPDLPDLPRPPKIPALPEPVVQLVSNLKPIFQILCLLKKGFVPIPEAKLATEIETLTQPSVQVVLPIVKNLGIQIPPVTLDAWEQIRINVKIDFGIDTEFIYLIVKMSAEIANYGTEYFVEQINKVTNFPLQQWIDGTVQKAVDDAANKIDEAIEEAVNETDEGLDAVSDEVSLEQIHPGLGEIEKNLLEMNDVLTEYVATLEADQEDYPETFYLTASQELLESDHPLLNRSIAEIELEMRYEQLPQNEEMQHLYALRGELIAYANNLHDSNQLLENIESYDEFTKVLVHSDESLDRVASLASDNFEKTESDTIKTGFFGSGVEDRLLAFETDLDPQIQFDPSEGLAQGGSGPQAAPKGFYVIKDEQNESVLTYTDELGGIVHTVFTDSDKDKDEDLILVLGGDVYWKENYEFSKPRSKGDVISSTSSNSVADYQREPDLVTKVSVPLNAYKLSELTWEVSDDNAPAYEVLVLNSLDQDEDDAEKYYLAIADEAYVAEEDYDALFVLDNPASPKLSLELDNGIYYAVIYALDAEGERSIAAVPTLLAPSLCGDDDAPFPAVSIDTVDISIYEKFELDTSGSFDPSGEIVEYSLEINAPNPGNFEQTVLPNEAWDDINEGYDSDGDGISSNDHSNPSFSLGPFTHPGDVGLIETVLNVVDQAGNSSSQPIDINVFVPDIYLDGSLATTPIVSGELEPLKSSIPYLLMRERFIYRVVEEALVLFPRLESIETPSIGESGTYLTFEDGSYEISDFNLDPIILVENSVGEVIAEIHTETGNIQITQDGYETIVNPAVPPATGGSIDIVDASGKVLATVHVVADANIDIEIHDGELSSFDGGVHFVDKETSDEFVAVSFPASDPSYPGGISLYYENENKQLMIVDTAGNVIILDDRITIDQKKNDHMQDAFAINIFFEGELIAEVHIIVTGENLQIVGPNDVPQFVPRSPVLASLFGTGTPLGAESFLDITDELRPVVGELYEKGIIDPLQQGDSLYLNPQHKVTRAEFTKTLLIMLCIVPREEAYLAFQQDGFSDIFLSDEDLEPYYAYIKEAAMLDIIDGYKGTVDLENGLNPFKPYITISRAEAVKIILEALQLREVIDIRSVEIGEPWYDPFMEVAQNLDPYVIDSSASKGNFIITSSEAENPTEAVTYEDMLLMASRVLDLYDCYDIDSDGDGMTDHCEEKHGISDPDADEDNDGLNNLLECKLGSDPRDKDTDKGGVFDGDEHDAGTNMLDAIDDSPDDDGDGLTNLEEIIVYGTDPYDPDTDDGGVDDGTEVANITDPLDGSDDGGEGDFDGDPGIYAIPAECNSCPCTSTLLPKADIVPGDTFFTVIPTDNFGEHYFEAKSNEVIIKSVSP